jgi:hypothetical protein
MVREEKDEPTVLCSCRFMIYVPVTASGTKQHSMPSEEYLYLTSMMGINGEVSHVTVWAATKLEVERIFLVWESMYGQRGGASLAAYTAISIGFLSTSEAVRAGLKPSGAIVEQ